MIDAFSALEALPRWMAWREERRGSERARPTKVPYAVGEGNYGSSTDPATWGTRQAAEARMAMLVNGAMTGIGVVLGEIDGERSLIGIDLDSCLDENGQLAPWAVVIVSLLGTYAEVSPSGHGLKAFAYIGAEHVRPFLDAIGVEKDAWGTRRSIPELDGAAHGPAVEVYAGARYFTVTERLWSVDHPRIELIDWPRLEELAPLIPPPANGSSRVIAWPGSARRGGARPSSGGDDSRSARAARIAIALMPDSYEEMVEELRRYPDPDIKSWVEDKGEAYGERELKRIWQRIVARRAEARAAGLTELEARIGPETSEDIEPDPSDPEPEPPRAKGHGPAADPIVGGGGGAPPPPGGSGAGGAKDNSEHPPREPPPSPQPVPPVDEDIGPLPEEFSDEQLALQFTAMHRVDWRYVALWGKWLQWTATRWRIEDTLRAFELARRVCRAASARARPEKLARDVAKASTVAGVERLARADRRHARTCDQWNENDWAVSLPPPPTTRE